jgi:general stress protein 26
MNSIHAQQSDDTHEDLTGSRAVAKIQDLAGRAKTCFFCTSTENGPTAGSRPMNVRDVDDEGNLWFLSASDSHLNSEVADNPKVKLYFQGAPHSDFMELQGYAVISREKSRIEELWEPFIQTWFTEGVDDPRITVIKVAPAAGYYWDTKHGHAVAGVKMLIGSLTGKTVDDSVEGRLVP